jgi:uncharacterized protein with FMN-binding domain
MNIPTVFRLACVLIALAGSLRADTIEFINGAKAEGKLQSLDAAAKTVTFEAAVGGRTVTRTFPQSQVHAVTVSGERKELTPKPGAPGTKAEAAKSSAEMAALIKQAGTTPPDWLPNTPLNFPQTLDLSWPEKPPEGWNNSKNVGQFIWDIINPNENRWREGVRFLEHLRTLHRNDARLQKRITKDIAAMHFRFFQDYARAAWGWQQVGIKAGDPEGVQLAECYWRLGNKQMALDMITGQRARLGMIKLLGDMGDTDKALQMVDTFVRAMAEPQEALVMGGDACRLAGRYEEALAYYERVLKAPVTPERKERLRRVRDRAQASIAAIRLFELSDVTKVADGTYEANSLGYEGPVQVAVAVKGGRIESVKVTQHREKQYYSALRDMPQQIIAKQGVKGVDATSRATITGNAIINATAEALAKGAQ